MYSRILLFIHSKRDSLHLLTSPSQSIPLPSLIALATKSLFWMSVSLVFVDRFICAKFHFIS